MIGAFLLLALAAYLALRNHTKVWGVCNNCGDYNYRLPSGVVVCPACKCHKTDRFRRQ